MTFWMKAFLNKWNKTNTILKVRHIRWHLSLHTLFTVRQFVYNECDQIFSHCFRSRRRNGLFSTPGSCKARLCKQEMKSFSPVPSLVVVALLHTTHTWERGRGTQETNKRGSPFARCSLSLNAILNTWRKSEGGEKEPFEAEEDISYVAEQIVAEYFSSPQSLLFSLSLYRTAVGWGGKQVTFMQFRCFFPGCRYRNELCIDIASWHVLSLCYTIVVQPTWKVGYFFCYKRLEIHDLEAHFLRHTIPSTISA